MQQGSQRDRDEVVWNTVAIKIGASGMDLRQPAAPDTLADLINARFVSELHVGRRSGHRSVQVIDDDAYPALSSLATTGWLYGHGQKVEGLLGTSNENDHYPVAGQARSTFRFLDSDVVWTGDRLLTVREGTSLGKHPFWSRTGTESLPMGIPAYLPTMEDSFPLATVNGNYLNTVLTSRYRIVVWKNGASLHAQIISRETGAIINQSEISGISNDPVEPVVLESSGRIVCLWRDFTGRVLYLSSWTGLAWTAPTAVQSSVAAWDVCTVSGGFVLAWRVDATGVLKIGKYTGTSTSAVPFAFNTTIEAGTEAGNANGGIAIEVASDGSIGVLWSTAAKLLFREYTSSMTALGTDPVTVDANGSWGAGISLRTRTLRTSSHWDWVVHGSRSSTAGTIVRSVRFDGTTYSVGGSTTRYNATLASRSFHVGDEVFCWLRSDNGDTLFLLAGINSPQIAGYADRQEALAPTVNDGVPGLPRVTPDPNDATGMLHTWVRAFNTGQSYARGGNSRFGDLNFLPTLSHAHFGRSVYLSGSAVKNWDGVQLGDAGFHDYPEISGLPAEATGGSLTATGTYRVRIYAVRYNAQGERFQSSALTSAAFTLTGANNQLTWTIKTLPSVTTDDVVFEIYRTKNGGTAYFLDGSVANTFGAATVSFVSTMADTALDDQPGDTHEAGIGQFDELEEWGPIGCTIIAAVGDRLWSAGGQVPRGSVQYSKLKEQGEGVGHDDLAPFQEVDITGGRITSIAGFNETVVAFQANTFSLIAPPGPDNYGRGAFTAPQVILADGAVNHAGTTLTPAGVVYWSSHGPMLLTRNLETVNISAQVRSLAETLIPSGVRVDLERSDVVWFTEGGDALLWNFTNNGRWARWTGLPAASVSSGAIVTPDGFLLYADDDAEGDNGQPFEFAGSTGWARPEDLLAGHTRFRSFGFVGEYLGQHDLRFRIFYDGSPLWAEEETWHPEVDNWLVTVGDLASLTPAQVDALKNRSRSGRFSTHKRVVRQDCLRFRIEFSDVASSTPTFIPHEIICELGALPGNGRTPITTFTGSAAR